MTRYPACTTPHPTTTDEQDRKTQLLQLERACTVEVLTTKGRKPRRRVQALEGRLRKIRRELGDDTN